MRLLWVLALSVFAMVGCSGEEPAAAEPLASAEPPAAVASAPEPAAPRDMWPYVVNNALRVADDYAQQRNARATAINGKTEYIEQVAGEYAGRHLLKIVSEGGTGTSFFMMLPLFDEKAPLDGLDDEKPLWKVVVAKHNGRPF